MQLTLRVHHADTSNHRGLLQGLLQPCSEIRKLDIQRRNIHSRHLVLRLQNPKVQATDWPQLARIVLTTGPTNGCDKRIQDSTNVVHNLINDCGLRGGNQWRVEIDLRD
jgi:hypothetical protein